MLYLTFCASGANIPKCFMASSIAGVLGASLSSTRFRKLTSTFLHTALLVREHRDESIAVSRREFRSCGYSISPPSAALNIARTLARITSGNVGQAATIRARSGLARADSSEFEETVSETFFREVRQPLVQPALEPPFANAGVRMRVRAGQVDHDVVRPPFSLLVSVFDALIDFQVSASLWNGKLAV